MQPYHVRGEDDVIHCILAANGFPRSTLATIFASHPASRARRRHSSDLRHSVGRRQPGNLRQSRRSLNVCFVFFGQRFSRQTAPSLLIPLLLERGPPTVTSVTLSCPELPVLLTGRDHRPAADVTRHDVSRQAFVVDTDFFLSPSPLPRLASSRNLSPILRKLCLL